MVKLTPISFALAGISTLALAYDTSAPSSTSLSGVATIEQSILGSSEQAGASITQNEVQDTAVLPTTAVAASSSCENREISTEASSTAGISEHELGIEVETWSFCSEGWLVPLGWIGLCPDRFDFRKVNTLGTTRTVTSTRTPSRRPTHSKVSHEGSASIDVVTRTKLLTSITTETSTETRTETDTSTTTETSTKISTETSTKTMKVVSTSTLSVTMTEFAEVENAAPHTVTETETETDTSILHMPTTITYTKVEVAIPDDLATVTVTSTSTTISTTTKLTEPTATMIVYEDGPGPNNTNCFGGAGLPNIQREGCENFYALHWTEQLMAWIMFIMPYCLICFALDLFAKALFDWLPKMKIAGAATTHYSDPFDTNDGSADPASGPVNPPAPMKEAPEASNGVEEKPASDLEDKKVTNSEVDRAANMIIEQVRNSVIEDQLCNPEDPEFGCWMLLLLNEQYENFVEKDYCRAHDLIRAKYASTKYMNADIRVEPTIAEAKSGAVQRIGPQNLNEIREKIRQWGDANHDAATAKEIRTFVDEEMVPEHETDDPLFICTTSQRLVGWSSGYGIIGPVPLWRLQLDVALVARMQEHERGDPWSPQFEGNENLWELKAKDDVRWAPKVAKLESALKEIGARAEQAADLNGSAGKSVEPKQEDETERVDPRGYDLEKHGDDYLNFVEKQLRSRAWEMFQQKGRTGPTQTTTNPKETTSTPIESITSATEQRTGSRVVSATKLLTEIPMSPEISPTSQSAPIKLQIEGATEPVTTTSQPENTTITTQHSPATNVTTTSTNAPTNDNDASTPAEPKKVVPVKIKRRTNPMFSKGGSPANSPTTGSAPGAGFGRRKPDGKDILRRHV